MELIDAWGKPLRFYRWPTRLVRGGAWSAGGFTPSPSARAMMPALPTTTLDLVHDSDDKYGFLKVTSTNPQNGLLVAEATYFEQGAAPMANRLYNLGAFHTPETFTLPLVISGGTDLDTGMFEPSDMTVTTLGYLGNVDSTRVNNTFDNISNYNVRSGGQ
jgi:hypothetical protein